MVVSDVMGLAAEEKVINGTWRSTFDDGHGDDAPFTLLFSLFFSFLSYS